MDEAIGVYVELLFKTMPSGNDEDKNTCKMNDQERLAMKLLQKLELESGAEARDVLARHLLSLVPSLGLRIVRWRARIARTCESVLSLPGLEGTCKAAMLRVLLVSLSVEDLPPPYATHLGALLKILFRLLYESSKEASAWEVLAPDCIQCLKILKAKCPKEFDSKTRGMLALDINPVFNGALSQFCD